MISFIAFLDIPKCETGINGIFIARSDLLLQGR